eukprot:GHVU01124931.1.p1 GENE.GHVU01124931.1~~GHVU01124931.1.p1  ORF type:complete len:159 (+),score=21.72 GHVU01124931.1:54-479(+)
MSHANLEPFSDIYESQNRMGEITIAARFWDIFYYGWQENPAEIKDSSEAVKSFGLWKDAHFRGYLEGIERFLGKASGSLFPESDQAREPTTMSKSFSDPRNIPKQEEDDVYLRMIIQRNIKWIQDGRIRLYEDCKKRYSGA